MKLKVSNPYCHILFWVIVAVILDWIFGSIWDNNLHAFYFITMQLPVVMATSYFFNYYLVPTFLLKKKYFLFGLYLFYMFVLSLYVQMIVVIFSFIYFTNFNLEAIGGNIVDQILLLGFVMYVIVFIGAFFVMVQQLVDRQKELDLLITEKEKAKQQFLELISNRQNVRVPYDEILYIESLSDYIKVHLQNGKEVVSKERISVLNEKLPEMFLRIHRSFIVNTHKIASHNSNEVVMDETSLNIGRSYKKEVLPVLKAI